MNVAQKIVSDIVAHQESSGASPVSWYAGIAADPDERLFVNHHVRRQGDWWIFRKASSANEARAIEQQLLAVAGFQGGPGGGDNSTVFVYAYKVEGHTVE
jgi:hypothetical protein